MRVVGGIVVGVVGGSSGVFSDASWDGSSGG
jgi:hypothetical protein